MSIVSYHARVNSERLAAIRSDPETFWTLPEHAGSESAEMLYLDKDWATLSYLLSQKARDEAGYMMALIAVQRRESEDNSDDQAWRAAMREEARKLGFEFVDTRALPDDPLLIAIAGRGTDESRIADIGYGATIFTPEEVTGFAAELGKITMSDLRKHWNPKTMEILDVAGVLWTEEEPSVFDDVIVRCFERLQTFFQNAAEAKQYVLVAHS
ncbi:MAG: DUF1877 family protein [Proteobacteria bacterium]|nr:DUF1877 family protein [Pseudomonadota bacterium]